MRVWVRNRLSRRVREGSWKQSACFRYRQLQTEHPKTDSVKYITNMYTRAVRQSMKSPACHTWLEKSDLLRRRKLQMMSTHCPFKERLMLKLCLGKWLVFGAGSQRRLYFYTAGVFNQCKEKREYAERSSEREREGERGYKEQGQKGTERTQIIKRKKK